MKGFTFFTSGKDIFVNTRKRNKTDALAKEIIDSLSRVPGFEGIQNTPEERKKLLSIMLKANCELRKDANGRGYFDIYGDNFGGKGSYFGDGKSMVLTI